jgi:hypothetical protein
MVVESFALVLTNYFKFDEDAGGGVWRHLALVETRVPLLNKLDLQRPVLQNSNFPSRYE